jgi:RNA-directed DNA polymerase
VSPLIAQGATDSGAALGRPAGSQLQELMAPDKLRQIFETRLQGTITRGVDRIDPSQLASRLDEELAVISRKVAAGTYRFAPYQESLRLKGRGKPPRVIAIATVRDRIVLGSLKELLHERFPECVARTLPNEYVRQLTTVPLPSTALTITKCDIRGFYDEIPHAPLLALLETRLSKAEVRMVERAVRNPTVTSGRRAGRRRRLQPRGKGVPQGLSISNILAEIYIHSLDEALAPECALYLRYVDDILLVVDESRRGDVKAELIHRLEKLGLELADDKNASGPLGMQFDYLGYEIQLPRLSVKRATVDRLIASFAAELTSFKHHGAKRLPGKWLDDVARQRVLVDELNERITGAISGNRRYGWLFYFSEINDERLLHHLDAVIRGLWTRTLGGPPPPNLKRFARAFHEVRHDAKGPYILNYNAFATTAQQLSFLVERGVLDPASEARFTPEQVESLFLQVRARSLSRLEADVGVTS